MKFFLLFILLGSVLLIESLWIQIPFLFIMVVLLAIIYQEQWIFAVALIGGVILDCLTFRPLGSSSLFLCSCLFLIFLYQKKFEIQSLLFVLGATFVGSLVYFLIFGCQNLLLQLLVTGIVSGASFFVLLFLSEKVPLLKRVVV